MRIRFQVAGIALVVWCAALTLTLGGCGGVVDKDAEKALHAKLGSTSVTVFPAFVRDGQQKKYDAGAAKAIGDFFTEKKLATVTVATGEVPITSAWGMNQAKMFRGSVADFQAYVRANPIQTEYGLLPEYLIGGQNTVVGIHLYLLDAQGTCAYAVLLNSHHKAFNDVNPKTVDACTKIVLNVLRAELTPETGK
jgi:hypothetical protein